MYKIIKSNISSDMNKPCWKLAKACPQSQKLFCFGENNLPVSKISSPKQAQNDGGTDATSVVEVPTEDVFPRLDSISIACPSVITSAQTNIHLI